MKRVSDQITELDLEKAIIERNLCDKAVRTCHCLFAQAVFRLFNEPIKEIGFNCAKLQNGLRVFWSDNKTTFELIRSFDGGFFGLVRAQLPLDIEFILHD